MSICSVYEEHIAHSHFRGDFSQKFLTKKEIVEMGHKFFCHMMLLLLHLSWFGYLRYGVQKGTEYKRGSSTSVGYRKVTAPFCHINKRETGGAQATTTERENSSYYHRERDNDFSLRVLSIDFHWVLIFWPSQQYVTSEEIEGEKITPNARAFYIPAPRNKRLTRAMSENWPKIPP